MTILTNFAKGIANFLIILKLVQPINHNIDLYTFIGYVLAFSLGLLLRIVVEWDANTLTWKKSIIQAIMGLVLCYLCVLGGRDFFPNLKLEYCIFICSLFSIFIVGVLIKTFKLGFPEIARLLLKRLTAYDPKPEEDKK